MRAISVLSVFSAMAATCLVADAQSFNRVTAHLPYKVVIGSKQLPPGDYEILPVSGTNVGNLFANYSEDRASFEGLLSAMPALEFRPAPKTELVLYSNGQGEYTLDRLWIQGDTKGYEFLAPKSGVSREQQASSVEVRAEATR
jgi:hypothetical protein